MLVTEQRGREQVEREVAEYARQVLDAMGIENGPGHMEVTYSRRWFFVALFVLVDPGEERHTHRLDYTVLEPPHFRDWLVAAHGVFPLLSCVLLEFNAADTGQVHVDGPLPGGGGEPVPRRGGHVAAHRSGVPRVQPGKDKLENLKDAYFVRLALFASRSRAIPFFLLPSKSPLGAAVAIKVIIFFLPFQPFSAVTRVLMVLERRGGGLCCRAVCGCRRKVRAPSSGAFGADPVQWICLHSEQLTLCFLSCVPESLTAAAAVAVANVFFLICLLDRRYARRLHQAGRVRADPDGPQQHGQDREGSVPRLEAGGEDRSRPRGGHHPRPRFLPVRFLLLLSSCLVCLCFGSSPPCLWRYIHEGCAVYGRICPREPLQS